MAERGEAVEGPLSCESGVKSSEGLPEVGDGEKDPRRAYGDNARSEWRVRLESIVVGVSGASDWMSRIEWGRRWESHNVVESKEEREGCLKSVGSQSSCDSVREKGDRVIRMGEERYWPG